MGRKGRNVHGKSLTGRSRGERPRDSRKKSADVHTRLARPAEAGRVAEVLLEAFREFRSLYTDGGFAATTPDADKILARLNEGPIWVAVRDGVIVGTVSAVKKGESVYIRSMAVLPAARGTGAGTQLLQQVETWAADEGCARLFLSTTPFLDSAIRLYERSGFRRIDDGPHDLLGTPLFTMEKIRRT